MKPANKIRAAKIAVLIPRLPSVFWVCVGFVLGESFVLIIELLR